MPVVELPPPDWTPPSKVETRERRKIRFRWIRSYMGMTQAEVAERYGIDERTWRRYEVDGAMPGHELLAEIAEDTHLSPVWIIGEVE